MKVFMFDKVSEQAPSFGALPRGSLDGPRHPRTRLRGRADRPRRFHWEPALTVVAATVLAIESLVFVWVHASTARSRPSS
jgi:hypothetical protein